MVIKLTCLFSRGRLFAIDSVHLFVFVRKARARQTGTHRRRQVNAGQEQFEHETIMKTFTHAGMVMPVMAHWYAVSASASELLRFDLPRQWQDSAQGKLQA